MDDCGKFIRSKSPAVPGNNTSVNKTYKGVSLIKYTFKQGETDYNNKYNNQKGNKYNGENIVQSKVQVLGIEGGIQI